MQHKKLVQTRELLFLIPHPQKGLIDDLLAADWHPVCLDSIQRVSEICRDRDVSVGLIEIGESAFSPDLLPDLLAVSGPGFEWIALVARERLQSTEIRSAVARYCFDFGTKPVPAARLAVTLGRAYGMAQLSRGLADGPVGARSSHGIIGTSEAIGMVRRSIAAFAATDAPVLIVGETGTGKELTARAVHSMSGRRHGPLVAVNCGALPATLIQSELFGYERGAFTGADRRGIGKLEAANNGTIFLDEIGDLPSLMQVNLLRFLQEYKIQRLGGSAEIELNVRVIAATNVDLDRAVQEGDFREDLLYRLNVLPLRLPPLRERIEDIDLLADHIFQTYRHERRHVIKGFNQGARTAMRAHSWPGNVRELINRVRCALVVCEGCLIGAEDLGLDQFIDIDVGTLYDARCRAEREVVQRAFLLSQGNVSEAARRLKVTRNTLYRLMNKFGLEPKE